MPAFLTDWTFWAFVVATLALVLSQVPPVKHWFKKASLDVEVYSRIGLTHKVGNPNAQLHIIVSNNGGRPVRVRSMSVSILRNGDVRSVLPLLNYRQEPNDESTVLFTPFNLKPSDEWPHLANFLNVFSREDDRSYRQMESAIRTEISAKRQVQPPHDRDLVEADPDTVAPVIEFFEQRFDWLAGEYQLRLEVVGDKARCTKEYNFTIFESESEELRSVVNHYKYGAGIYWDRPDLQTSLLFQIHENES